MSDKLAAYVSSTQRPRSPNTRMSLEASVSLWLGKASTVQQTSGRIPNLHGGLLTRFSLANQRVGQLARSRLLLQLRVILWVDGEVMVDEGVGANRVQIVRS